MRSESVNSKKLENIKKRLDKSELDPLLQLAAIRTAFVARFIILREGRRSRAHRIIEQMSWQEDSTAEILYSMFRQAFIENGDKLLSVDRDLRRSLNHAYSSVGHFVDQYLGRSGLSFQEALVDYERSNLLLFGEEDLPRSGGWRLPSDTKREQ